MTFPAHFIASAGDVEVVDVLSGTLTRTSQTSFPVPTPTGAKAGDLQIVVFSWYTNSAFTAQAHSVAAGGWRPLALEWNSTGITWSNRVRIDWRILQGGDSDWTGTQSSGALTLNYNSVVIRNYRTDDPIFTAFFGGSGTRSNFSTGDNYTLPMPGSTPRSHISDFIVGVSYRPQTLGAYTLPSIDGRVKFATTALAGSNAPTIVTVGQTFNRATPPRLIGSGDSPLDGWTLTGVTSGAATAAARAKIVSTAGTARHAIYADITLTAGRRYFLGCRAHCTATSTGAYGTYVYFTFTRPLDSSEHGLGFCYNDGTSVVGSLVSAGDGVCCDGYNNTSGSGDNWSQLLGISFTAPETGTYRLYISLAQQNSRPPTANLDNQTGDTGRSLATNTVMFYEVGHAQELLGIEKRVDTSYGIPEVYPLIMPRPAATQSTSDAAAIYLSFRARNSGFRPACQWHAPLSAGRIALAPDNISNNNCGLLQSPTTLITANYNLYSTHVVGFWNSVSSKFYFEVTISSLSAAARNAIEAVGVQAGISLGAEAVSGGFTQLNGSYGITRDGRVDEDGSYVRTGMGDLVAGDIVGVLIRFDNNTIEFYRNGAAYDTVNIASGQQTQPFRAACYHVYNQTNYIDSTWRQSANFTGPFSGRLPSGAVPFDFDNAVA